MALFIPIVGISFIIWEEGLKEIPRAGRFSNGVYSKMNCFMVRFPSAGKSNPHALYSFPQLPWASVTSLWWWTRQV